MYPCAWHVLVGVSAFTFGDINTITRPLLSMSLGGPNAFTSIGYSVWSKTPPKALTSASVKPLGGAGASTLW